MRKNIYDILPDQLDQQAQLCLATLVATRGSVPQVPGSSALYAEHGRLAGTLGGGVMEGDAGKKAAEAIRTGRHRLEMYNLDADIRDNEGALCGGYAKVLLDPDPGRHADCFREMAQALDKGVSGLLLTVIPGDASAPLLRSWIPAGETVSPDLPGNWEEIEKAMDAAGSDGKCHTLENATGDLLFIEPVSPAPQLYIAGAGHIGKALAHQGMLLDFEVTVIDDRAEFASPDNIPDADHLIVKSIGDAMEEIPFNRDTYVVIVTRGHQDDAAALKACIKHDIPYIGMIGSRKKLRTMKEQFIRNGWSTQEEFERIHAPVGLEIGSVSVQEIALSIAAQLVQVRAKHRSGKKRSLVTTVILGAGESRRMGKPKMLLPWGSTTIIGTVINSALESLSDHVCVVLGADADKIAATLPGRRVEKVLNSSYRDGMLSSVQAGIRSLPPTTTAVMILLGDQPMISAEIMDRAIDRYRQSDKKIIIASVNGRRGHPLIFNAEYIPEILAYGPEDTLRTLQDKHPEEVEELETGNTEILRDIDTPRDYENELKTRKI